MTRDPVLIVAEARAEELLQALKAAVMGASYWRRNAQYLLAEIEALVLPESTIQSLKEIDARKREAEILRDLHQPTHIEEGPDGF